MGSSYLLAHGLGTPVEDAVTKIEIPQSGQYRIFVRTKNWTAHWVDKEKHAPGAFRLRIDGRDCDTLFGTGDPEWHWQAGGTTYLTEGVHQVALHDLAGFDARCDAILFTLHDVAPDDSKRSSGCATTCSACPPNPKSGGRSISSSRAAAWPACAPPSRRRGRGCAWR